MFKVGDKVRFGRVNGEQTLGVIVKILRKNVKVRQLEARGTYGAGTVWTVSPTLVTHEGVTVGERPRAEVMRDILDCYVGLSPENLWCDGEATATHARSMERRLKARLQELFGEFGRVVEEAEAYGMVRV